MKQKSINRAVRNIYTRISTVLREFPSTVNAEEPLTIDEMLATMSAPSGDFAWECDEGADYPYWCDNCKTWHRQSIAVDFGRVNGRGYLTARVFDGDCSWDEVAHWEAGEEDESYAQDWREYCGSLGVTRRFLDWADYHAWMAEHPGQDPAKEWIRPEHTPEDNIKSARDYIKCAIKCITNCKRKEQR